MNRFAIAGLAAAGVAAVGLIAAFFIFKPSSAPTRDVTVADVRGQCWTLAGSDGIRYAVKAEQGQKLGLKPGQKITLRGRVASKQDCAAAVVIEVR